MCAYACGAMKTPISQCSLCAKCYSLCKGAGYNIAILLTKSSVLLASCSKIDTSILTQPLSLRQTRLRPQATQSCQRTTGGSSRSCKECQYSCNLVWCINYLEMVLKECANFSIIPLLSVCSTTWKCLC